MRHGESILQRACKKWFNLQYPQFKRLLFAIPNGGFRNPREAAMLIGEGVEPGVTDMMLAVPRNGMAGAFIEFKYGDNKPTDKQTSWMDLAGSMGYVTQVVYDFDEFRKFIDGYLHAISAKGIVRTVCRHYGTTPEQIMTKCQKRELVESRQVIMFLSYKLLHKNANNAAALFDKDHATFTHAKKQVKCLYETNKIFKERMDNILRELRIHNFNPLEN